MRVERRVKTVLRLDGDMMDGGVVDGQGELKVVLISSSCLSTWSRKQRTRLSLLGNSIDYLSYTSFRVANHCISTSSQEC